MSKSKIISSKSQDNNKNKSFSSSGLSLAHNFAQLNLNDLDLTTETYDFNNINDVDGETEENPMKLSTIPADQSSPRSGDYSSISINERRIQENLEDDVVNEAFTSGIDLRQYSHQINQQLLSVEGASIQDYIKESNNIASLHQQIGECDGILERMEGMLQGFQTDLSSISTEIQTLQEQSVAMNVKLKNRQAIRGELSQFVAEMAVPEIMIKSINDSPVTERDFVEGLHELNHKINFVKEQSFKESKSTNDVKDVLEKLKVRALGKIREFLLSKIYQFRRPMTNYQIPQDLMLKFRFFNEFLLSNERHVAKEIRDEYVDTMGKVYFSYFKSYFNRVMKLEFEAAADKTDMMGREETQRRSIFSTRPSLKHRATVFTLGDREKILQDSELLGPIIVPHAAQKQDQRYTYEALFRSIHFALFDNSCREYLFLSDFFMISGNPAQELFIDIIGRSLTFFLQQVDLFLRDCFDCIAIFICIHIVIKYQVLMIQRYVPALNKYWEGMLELFWPRFEYVLQLNIASIRDCDPQRLPTIDVRPHYITRRYAEFSAGILTINQHYPSDKVAKLLAMLQTEVEGLILRAAAQFPDRSQQLVFLINNYDMMLSVIAEHLGPDAKESDSVKHLLAIRTDEFIGLMLDQYFGSMIAFVKDSEYLIEKMPPGYQDKLKANYSRISGIIKSFNSGWKSAMDQIHQHVMESFSNFKTGTPLFQGALTQLIQWYHRFQKVVGHSSFKNNPALAEMMNIHQVMVEVKKFKSSF